DLQYQPRHGWPVRSPHPPVSDRFRTPRHREGHRRSRRLLGQGQRRQHELTTAYQQKKRGIPVKQLLKKIMLGAAMVSALATAASAAELKKVTYAIATADLNVGYPFATLAKHLGYFEE